MTKSPRIKKVSLLAVLVCLGAALSPAAAAKPSPADPVLTALEKELVRCHSALRDATEGAPLYFLGYEIRDSDSWNMTATNGAIAYDAGRRYRGLDVDVRVGTPQLDNTHQFKGPGGRFEFPQSAFAYVTVEDDEAAIRADVWRRTDLTYRDAVGRYTKVKTNKAVTAVEEDTSADFSEEQPSTFYDRVSLPRIPLEEWRLRLREVSAALKPHAFVQRSSVSLSVQAENRYLVNTEGTRVVTGNIYARLSYNLGSRTEDGMELSRSRSYDVDSLGDLPSNEVILADLATSVAELESLLEAPLVEPYTGPALIRNRATAVFFHEILGHRLEGHRQKLEAEGQTFTKMLGKPITAEFISVYDDPTLSRFGDHFLRGFYRFDDEGIPASRVTLVENGVLESFLLSRSPIANFPHSNGHGRRSTGRAVVARMGNTIVEASETVSYERLREMLIEEIRRQDKPYGYVFDDISGGFTSTRRGGTQSFKVIPLLVYRVYADGRPDEAVRGVDIVGTPLTAFSKIVAAADDYDIFNGSCGAESGYVPVSAVAPSILVSEIEIEKKAKSSQQPPILPPPLHDTEGSSP